MFELKQQSRNYRHVGNFPTCRQMSCRLDTLADTTFSCVCDMTEKCRDMSPDTTQNVASWAQKRHADIRHVELSSPSSNKATLHRHHLRRFQSSHLQRHQRESRPQQPHEHVRLHRPHAPRSIIDGHMIYHPQEISSNISTVQSDLQKSQPSYKPSKKGTTDPFQASAWRMSPCFSEALVVDTS